MIVIKVELHNANTGKVTEIASAKVWNDGGTKEAGVYGSRFDYLQPGAVGFDVVGAKGFAHARADHVWKLIQRALNAAFPE